MDSKWHLIIKFRCQNLSFTVNFWGVYFFGFVYIPPEAVGLQTSQTTVPISEITEMVTKLDVKSFSTVGNVEPLFIHTTHICSSFFLNGLPSQVF